MGKLIFYHKHHPLSGRQWRPVSASPYTAEIISRARCKELNLLYTDSARARQWLLLKPLAALACSL